MNQWSRVFRSLKHMIASLALIAIFLFIIKRIINLFLFRVSEQAVLLEILKIDFEELFLLGIFLIPLFFSIFLVSGLMIFIAGKLFNWTKEQVTRLILFAEKLCVALFPTFLLAGSLDTDSFVTMTSIISFFAIFSFVFKANIFEKSVPEHKNRDPKRTRFFIF